MVRDQVKCGKNTNCTQQDKTSLLACTTISAKPKIRTDDTLSEKQLTELLDKISLLPEAEEFSEFKKGCVGYISGFVAMQCQELVDCEDCVFSLLILNLNKILTML